MKILLYFEGMKLISKSGIGQAFKHQKQALELAGIEYTTDVKSVDFDILHINTYGIQSFGMIKRARKLGKKVIYHAHSTEEDFRNSFIFSNQLSPLYKKYLIKLYLQADLILTPTDYSKSILQEYEITPPIEVVSNGVDLEKFRPCEKKESLFREYFHLHPEEKVVMGVGLYFERKGIVDFVELAKRFPHVRFIWFGYTPQISVPSSIWRLVKNHGLKNLEFPGYINGEILEGAYSGADCFFFPSYEETEGIVVLEALASKQRVLLREIPVYEGWLKKGVHVEKGKSNEEFARQLDRLLSDRNEAMCEAGYEVARARSIREVSKQLKTFYESVQEVSFV